jgi:hypothetical protein
MGYKKTLAQYLQSIGQLDAHHLGDSESQFTDSQRDQLARQLEHQYANNHILIWLAAFLWIVLFVLGACFAIHFRNNLTGLSLLFGGSFMALGGNMLALRRLWLDSSIIGALLAILPGLTPNEAAKVITTFYFNAIDGRGRSDAKASRRANRGR